MPDFDVIVVGAGPSGSVTSYLLAKKGYSVLLVDRGKRVGSKNMFGGRLYAWSLEEVFPNFWEEAPVEREVRKEVLGFISGEEGVEISLSLKPEAKSFTLLRAKFDEWLSQKAEDAGVEVVSGIRVDSPWVDGGRVKGIIAEGEEKLESEVVVAADGVLSFLAEKAGLRPPLNKEDFAVGVKEVIELPKETIEDRFGLEDGEGSAQLYVGFTGGVVGGGFIYTNTNTVSVGVVARIGSFYDNLANVEYSIWNLIDSFKSHPLVRRYLRGGKLVEYSAHLIPETQFLRDVKLYGDGIILVGDAAGFCVNYGVTVRGMDFAIESAKAAAEAVDYALNEGGASSQNLSRYEELLSKNVLRELNQAKKAVDLMENPRIYKSYPNLVVKVMKHLFQVDGKPKKSLYSYSREVMSREGVSLLTALRDIWKMLRSL